MVFSYYNRLSARDRKIYRASDRIESVKLSGTAPLYPLIDQLERALAAGLRPSIEHYCQLLADGINLRLAAPPVEVRVLAVRPSDDNGELHGLYEGVEGRRRVARISLWMKTAQRKQVVAFRSFLRTLLHELCHHLDYEHFKFADSFHTEGFYKRESSLFHQLVSVRAPAAAADRG